MYIKATIFCAVVLLVQTISAQCGCNAPACGCPNAFAAPACGCPNAFAAPACGCPNALAAPAYGCSYAPRPCAASLTISPCPLAGAPNIPAGMSIASDNLLITGPVAVAGKLPFAGTVALEGVLPAYGAGAVSYGCGYGDNIAVSGPGFGYVGGCGCGGLVY